jgi:hypothetical protein
MERKRGIRAARQAEACFHSELLARYYVSVVKFEVLAEGAAEFVFLRSFFPATQFRVAAHPRSATINHAPTCRRAAGAMARVQNRFASRDPKDQEDAENHPKGHQ